MTKQYRVCPSAWWDNKCTTRPDEQPDLCSQKKSKINRKITQDVISNLALKGKLVATTVSPQQVGSEPLWRFRREKHERALSLIIRLSYVGASTVWSEYIYHDEKCYRITNYGQTLQDVIEWTQNWGSEEKGQNVGIGQESQRYRGVIWIP